MRIVVTGGSGKAGRWVVRDLRDHGHYVTNVDTRHDGSEHGQTLLADLADYGQTAEALAGFDAVVHLAAIPAPGSARRRHVPQQRPLDVQRVCRGRSQRARARRLGVERDRARPAVRHAAAVRADRRDHRAATGDVLRPLEARRRDDGDPVRPADRDPDRGPADLEHHGARRLRPVPRRTGTTRTLRKWNLWGYVDCRDVAQACRLALTAAVDGAEVCIVAADDTVMTRPSADLMAEVFPRSRSTRESRAARRCSRSTGRAESSASARPSLGRPRHRAVTEPDSRPDLALGPPPSPPAQRPPVRTWDRRHGHGPPPPV